MPLDQPSLLALLDRIRGRLDELITEPLTDDQLQHLVAIDEWLASLSEEDADA
jgi:hypothetical protein